MFVKETPVKLDKAQPISALSLSLKSRPLSVLSTAAESDWNSSHSPTNELDQLNCDAASLCGYNRVKEEGGGLISTSEEVHDGAVDEIETLDFDTSNLAVSDSSHELVVDPNSSAPEGGVLDNGPLLTAPFFLTSVWKDFLFLGGKKAAQDKASLLEKGVVGVVNATSLLFDHYPESFRYHRVPVLDEPTEDILSHLEGATQFIHDIRTGVKPPRYSRVSSSHSSSCRLHGSLHTRSISIGSVSAIGSPIVGFVTGGGSGHNSGHNSMNQASSSSSASSLSSSQPGSGSVSAVSTPTAGSAVLHVTLSSPAVINNLGVVTHSSGSGLPSAPATPANQTVAHHGSISALPQAQAQQAAQQQQQHSTATAPSTTSTHPSLFVSTTTSSATLVHTDSLSPLSPSATFTSTSSTAPPSSASTPHSTLPSPTAMIDRTGSHTGSSRSSQRGSGKWTDRVHLVASTSVSTPTHGSHRGSTSSNTTSVTHPSSVSSTVTIPITRSLSTSITERNEEHKCSCIERPAVLVHCEEGVSRSASVVIAYLMRFENLSLREAMAHVERCRPSIKPNAGFLKQLEIFQRNLVHSAASSTASTASLTGSNSFGVGSSSSSSGATSIPNSTKRRTSSTMNPFSP